MKKVLVVLLVIFIIPWLLLFYRNYTVENSSFQKTIFLTGTFPSPLPEGSYNGHVPFLETPWKGKIFDASSSSGINLVKEKEILPFKTYKGKGLKDKQSLRSPNGELKNLDVLKIDYNIPQNPFWARLLLDELVQNAPDRYLGKAYLKLIPGFPLSLGFFKLER